MNNEIKEKILAAADKLEENLPPIDRNIEKNAAAIIERLKNRKNRKYNFVPDGYIGNPYANSEYLKDLRDFLSIFKGVVIPAAMRGEVEKLRSVGRMADTMIKTKQNG